MTIFAKIEDVLADKIAPSIAMHGGVIELINYDEETKNVHVKLSGSCAGCAASTITLKMGVEQTLKHYLPDDIKSVTHIESEITNPFYTLE